ncbi:MAG: DEAD/DEAH box helicase [Lactobacillales bacterium]|jgi:ATP-dependent RNA helicase CshB|nr:DEAD/DEAH box helicase [Lactobacillales bacterium]
MNSFESFGFQPFLYKALKESHFIESTEIQKRVIPLIQKGKSVIGEAQTGTGKTHAFLLPLIDKVDPINDTVQLVITAPSRELATQIYKMAVQLIRFSDSPIRVTNFVGGTDKLRQIECLKVRQPHVVIGTPGRLLDLIKNQALFVHRSSAFVVDEADMTLDMGFLNEVDKIASHLPKDIQMLVFSATIPEKLKPFLKKYLENPVQERLSSQYIVKPMIKNWLISTKGKDINSIVYQLLMISFPYLAIVFANTKKRVIEIHEFLKSQGLKVAMIHGDIPSRERKRVMKQVVNLEFQYLVATDLAARGIDIEGVSHVINAELPQDLDFFIHRIGRTGRNGLPGIAITLYDPSYEQAVKQLESFGIHFQSKVIKNEEIVDSYDRNRRIKRKKPQESLDIELIGLVKKKKRKIKPGYKKRIEHAIKSSVQKKRKVARREEERVKRKSRKQNY